MTKKKNSFLVILLCSWFAIRSLLFVFRLISSGNIWTVATYKNVPAENNIAYPVPFIDVNWILPV